MKKTAHQKFVEELRKPLVPTAPYPGYSDGTNGTPAYKANKEAMMRELELKNFELPGDPEDDQ